MLTQSGQEANFIMYITFIHQQIRERYKSYHVQVIKCRDKKDCSSLVSVDKSASCSQSSPPLEWWMEQEGYLYLSPVRWVFRELLRSVRLEEAGQSDGDGSSGKGWVLGQWLPHIYVGEPTPLPALPLEV